MIGPSVYLVRLPDTMVLRSVGAAIAAPVGSFSEAEVFKPGPCNLRGTCDPIAGLGIGFGNNVHRRPRSAVGLRKNNVKGLLQEPFSFGHSICNPNDGYGIRADPGQAIRHCNSSLSLQKLL
jgi:hypothetical protein